MGKKYITSPVGDKYSEFIIETVKPYIDEHYNTKPQREYTGIGGSSIGGINSLYMGLKYADVFDYGIIFSTSMHIYPDNTLDDFLVNLIFNNEKSSEVLYFCRWRDRRLGNWLCIRLSLHYKICRYY